MKFCKTIDICFQNNTKYTKAKILIKHWTPQHIHQTRMPLQGYNFNFKQKNIEEIEIQNKEKQGIQSTHEY